MNATPICKTCSQPLRVKLPAYAPDEKLAFVENVFSLLIESRFKNPRPYRLLIHLTDEPEREDHIFFDMTHEGPIPSYMIEFLNNEFIEGLVSDLVERRLGIFANLPLLTSPQNQARGSPASQNSCLPPRH
ncbi:MAG: hypothetical protein ABL999_11170 [Pyrinomonadaceae bacterium]